MSIITDDLTEAQLTDYFSNLIETHSWSAVKLDLYGLKFYTTHVLHKPWAMPNLIKPPKTQRLSVQPYSPGQGVPGQGTVAALSQAGLTLPPGVPVKWVVDCKCVGDGEKALVYLGRYLYRGVIQEKDILSCDNGQVRFRYRDGKTGKSMTRTVSGAAFLRLILQHVLPRGFRRARNFGFLHPNSKRLIALLQVVLKVIPGASQTWMKPRPPFLCKCCGAHMRIVRRRISATEHRPPGSGFAGAAEM